MGLFSNVSSSNAGSFVVPCGIGVEGMQGCSGSSVALGLKACRVVLGALRW